jgi:hypothetical protein
MAETQKLVQDSTFMASDTSRNLAQLGKLFLSKEIEYQLESQGEPTGDTPQHAEDRVNLSAKLEKFHLRPRSYKKMKLRITLARQMRSRKLKVNYINLHKQFLDLKKKFNRVTTALLQFTTPGLVTSADAKRTLHLLKVTGYEQHHTEVKVQRKAERKRIILQQADKKLNRELTNNPKPITSSHKPIDLFLQLGQKILQSLSSTP